MTGVSASGHRCDGVISPVRVSIATLDGQLTAIMANRDGDLSSGAVVATSALNARPHHAYPWSWTTNRRTPAQFLDNIAVTPTHPEPTKNVDKYLSHWPTLLATDRGGGDSGDIT